MNSNNNKFFLSTSQPFEQPVDDKPYEVLDTTSKSTASSPLHVGFENTRMDENMKDYAGTNYDAQDVGFDNKSTKPSQFNNIYINNSIALNFTSNNIMGRNEAPTMVRKMNSEPLYSNTPKSQTEQFETPMCLNCGGKIDLFQDTYCPSCHSCVIAGPKDQHTGSIQAQREEPKRKDLWSNYVNLAESQKNENLRINQPKFNPVAPPQNYNAFHPQSSQVIYPQGQANRSHQPPLPQPSANFSHERGIGKYSENIRREDYFAKQNNFGIQVQGNQGKIFEPSANSRIPPPPATKNPPPKLYEGPNYCDDEDKLSFKDELFTPVKKDSVAQEKGLKKEMLDKLDEMNFEEDFSFQGNDNDHNDGDDFDNMDGWQEMDLAGDESQHEKPTIPSIEERRNLAIAKKKVEVIDLSEHDSDKRSAGPESPKAGDLHKLFSKKHGEEAKDDIDEKPVGEIISFFLENSSKKTMLFQSEPVEETHLFSVPGIEESSSRTGTDENGDSRGKEVNYLNLIRAKPVSQSVSKIVRTGNKKIQKIEKGDKSERLEKVQHKEENQTSMKIDIGVSQTCLKGGLLPLLLNKVEDDSNHLTAERTEQIVQNLLAHNQSKTDLKEVKKPFVIQNKPKVKATGALKKLGTNLQKKEKALIRQEKKERLEKEKEKDLEREKEREINWEREHEREREKLKELERKMERKEKGKEKEKAKYKHKQKEKQSHKEKEHKKVEHKVVEEKESHREKETKKLETKMVEEKEKEKDKDKEKEKEKPKEKENKKIEAKMVEEKEKEKDLLSDCISDNSEYFMFGDEYDMILECYSQESEFVDVHEVKRRMDDFEFVMRDKEDIENIEEILYPKKITIIVGDQYQTKIPDLKTESLLGKGICKVWDPDRIQRQDFERFMENLSNITKLPQQNIKEERAAEILIDNNYNVDQALNFANEYLDFIKARIIYPQPKKTKEGVDKERERL